ncbi:MAG: ribosome recycling factor [Parcubacteria group bacterium CG2_30_44_11]|nr:MAG: ribosome recycling factor [Parcubacteria group bacterium CG2_30_44_11]
MIDFNVRSREIIDWLATEFTGIRTGQAAPALLDNVKVESYGSRMPINQIGTVSVEDVRTLRVSVWDAGQVKAVETAIREADLGVSLAVDSSGLRVIFPNLTSDRRVQLLKLAKQKHEEARVSVKTAREEAMKEIDKREKDGVIGEDAQFAEKEKVQTAVEATNRKLDLLLETKEVEISH